MGKKRAPVRVEESGEAEKAMHIGGGVRAERGAPKTAEAGEKVLATVAIAMIEAGTGVGVGTRENAVVDVVIAVRAVGVEVTAGNEVKDTNSGKVTVLGIAGVEGIRGRGHDPTMADVEVAVVQFPADGADTTAVRGVVVLLPGRDQVRDTSHVIVGLPHEIATTGGRVRSRVENHESDLCHKIA